jgi:hypothetical protein
MMRRIIHGTFGLAVAFAIAASACTEQSTPVGLDLAPRGTAALDIFGTSSEETLEAASDSVAVSGTPVAVNERVNVLQRDVPLASSITVSSTIGAAGGKIEIRDAGLKLVIPSGALTQATTITVTAFAGNGVAYDFQPHGLVFNKPLVATQAFRLRGTTIPVVQGAYFPDAGSLDLTGLTGQVTEREPTVVDLQGKKVKFNIPHFSGYLLSIDRY